MVMRWKILELAERFVSLDEFLAELKKLPEIGLDEAATLQILELYLDILPNGLQEQIKQRNKLKG